MREHLSVNGFCNWASVKLANRSVPSGALHEFIPYISTITYMYTALYASTPKSTKCFYKNPSPRTYKTVDPIFDEMLTFVQIALY